jgi:hypothetical protein
MDLTGSPRYVGTRMQFLLLLSALLSAVTGAFAGPRAADAPVNQVEAQQEAALVAPLLAENAAAARAPVQPIRRSASPRLPALIEAPAPSAPLTSVRWLE